jgi:large subunit ribosomal protein L29
MKNSKEIKDLEPGKLPEKLAQTEEELFKLRFQHATAQLEKTHRLGELRRDVARIKTAMKQKQGGR